MLCGSRWQHAISTSSCYDYCSEGVASGYTERPEDEGAYRRQIQINTSWRFEVQAEGSRHQAQQRVKSQYRTPRSQRGESVPDPGTRNCSAVTLFILQRLPSDLDLYSTLF